MKFKSIAGRLKLIFGSITLVGSIPERSKSTIGLLPSNIGEG